MSEERPKDFLDPNQLVRDPCCPFSKRSRYWHIWRSGVNRLAPAIYRVGRKIIISRSAFIKWLTSHQKGVK